MDDEKRACDTDVNSFDVNSASQKRRALENAANARLSRAIYGKASHDKVTVVEIVGRHPAEFTVDFLPCFAFAVRDAE